MPCVRSGHLEVIVAAIEAKDHFPLYVTPQQHSVETQDITYVLSLSLY